MPLQVPAAPVFPRFPGSENPYLAWRAFYRNLIDTFARAPVLSQHGKGLLGALLTPEQNAALPGVPLGEFYEPYLQPDDNPPVTAAAFPAWQWNMARFAQQQGAISVYTQAVISSLDPTPLARISAPDGTGTANFTLLHIITRLEELYGRLPAAVLTFELNKLDMPFAHGVSIHDHLTMHRTVHSVAASNGQPISGHQKSPIFMKAYANFPPSTLHCKCMIGCM
jgi:hypothetical protein